MFHFHFRRFFRDEEGRVKMDSVSFHSLRLCVVRGLLFPKPHWYVCTIRFVLYYFVSDCFLAFPINPNGFDFRHMLGELTRHALDRFSSISSTCWPYVLLLFFLCLSWHISTVIYHNYLCFISGYFCEILRVDIVLECL